MVVVDFVGHREEGCVIAGPLLHVDDEVAMRVHQVLFQRLQVRYRFLRNKNRIGNFLSGFLGHFCDCLRSESVGKVFLE